MMKKKFISVRKLYLLNIALEAVLANKFRSMLTALGIIFGVAAVIAMLAIGNGARQEILEQMKLVGVNNIIIMPRIENGLEAASEESQGKTTTKKFSPGLSVADAESIANIIPSVEKVSPEVVYESIIIAGGVSSFGKISGVTPAFFDVFNLELERGEMFNEEQLVNGKAVCILGASLKARLFPNTDPIGEYVKSGNIWLKVTGVLQNRAVSADLSENLGISDYNNQVYAPIQTLLLRYRDRSVITTAMIRGGSTGTVAMDGGMMQFRSSSGDSEDRMNQIDKIVVQVKETELIGQTTEVIRRMLTRRHSGVDDFEIKVPELLLKQEQRTKDIFNIVLGAIASISLIVGGIGIMNIMLASVMERTKEIGIRMATGATRRDVIFQFLAEATLISLTGGVTGIVLGLALARIIMQLTGILTIVSLSSILISFGVSASVGIIFGYMPARKAAMQDPVTSLRYE